jgi:hypothetical protein
MTGDLARVVHAARTPHGYTLATWGAGVLCIGKYGLPDLGGVLLFIGGATSAFGVILWVVRNWEASALAPRVPLAGIHIGTLSASTVTAWSVAALVPAPWGWCAASAISTGVFLVVHSAQDWAARVAESKARPTSQRRRTRNARIAPSLSHLVGCYRTLSTILHSCQVPLDSGVDELPLPPAQ